MTRETLFAGMRYAEPLHLTSRYLSGGRNPRSVDFEEGKSVELKILGVVVVPGKLLTGFCFPSGQLKVENKYPHVTFMVGGGWEPVRSNRVLELALEQPRIKHYLETGEFLLDTQTFVQRIALDMTAGESSCTAYLVKPIQPLVLKGVTGVQLS